VVDASLVRYLARWRMHLVRPGCGKISLQWPKLPCAWVMNRRLLLPPFQTIFGPTSERISNNQPEGTGACHSFRIKVWQPREVDYGYKQNRQFGPVLRRPILNVAMNVNLQLRYCLSQPSASAQQHPPRQPSLFHAVALLALVLKWMTGAIAVCSPTCNQLLDAAAI
jgi:hypothetical protein